MGHIEKLNQYFSAEHVIGGTAMIGTVLTKQAMWISLVKKALDQWICESNRTTRWCHPASGRWFKAAGMNPTLTTNFNGTLMAKVVFNSVVNTLCTMFKVRMGAFIQAPTTRALSVQLIDEAYVFVNVLALNY